MGHVALTLSLPGSGRYLEVTGGEQETRLRVGGPSIGPDAVFERVPLAHGRVALRTLAGHYLALRPDPHHNFGLYPEERLTPAAAFEEILFPTGEIALRSAELTYVSADAADGSPVVANRVEAGDGERFRYVDVPSWVLPEDVADRQTGVTDMPRQSEAPAVEGRPRLPR